MGCDIHFVIERKAQEGGWIGVYSTCFTPAFASRALYDAWLGTDAEDRPEAPDSYKSLPEFAKYLPQERDGKVIRSMPVIANLVADLMQAGRGGGRGRLHRHRNPCHRRRSDAAGAHRYTQRPHLHAAVCGTQVT